MMYVYGTKVFTKCIGSYGQEESCPACGKRYKQSFVRCSKWAHLDYIPIFPMKKTYEKICPICGHGVTLTNKEAKAEMAASQKDESQHIEIYAKHILAKKPKKLMEADQSYEIWARDLNTNEETRLAFDVSKEIVKETKKARGLKKINIIDV
ncbi:MAG: hypothetical protein IIY94_08700 [Oscillospiraceae bacterium]|nr:hypothetical protein [Oscillospiraceae bacterium]